MNIVLTFLDRWRARRGTLQGEVDGLNALVDTIHRRLEHVRVPTTRMEWEALQGADRDLAELAYLVRKWLMEMR